MRFYGSASINSTYFCFCVLFSFFLLLLGTTPEKGCLVKCFIIAPVDNKLLSKLWEMTERIIGFKLH